MPIPDYQTLMLPLLKFAADGKEHRTRDVLEPLAKEYGLTQDEQEQLLPSGRQTVLYDRLHWAKTYLSQAKLLLKPSRGAFQITELGRKALEKKPAKIDLKFLEQYDDFKQFRERSAGDGVSKSEPAVPSTAKVDEIPAGFTPDEQLQQSAKNLNEILAKDLRAEIVKKDDKFFENLVVDLLKKVFPHTSGRVTGKSHDRGIDGVILQDRFGLDRIVCQAKRFDKSPVGYKDISSFCHDVGRGIGTKGFFVTLSRFTAEARKCAAEHDSKNVFLIDGEELLKLMIEYNVGVKEQYKIEVKRVEADYFAEEE